MNADPAVAWPTSSARLTNEGRRLLEERIRLMDATVQELRAALDDELGAEIAEAHHRAGRELARLRAVVRDARSVEQVPDDPHTVVLGDTVTIELESGETERHIVVHPAEAPVDDRRISVTSPLGAALIGRRVGDQVEVRVPDGGYRCKILRARRIQRPSLDGNISPT
jgi:transcription elongation factor GreA